MSAAAGAPSGPAAGLRIVELCDEKGVLAGKLFADMGAEVIKIEPPAGDPTRHYAPFVDNAPGPERSLWFWYYNTSKRGITLDLEHEAARAIFRRLVAGADLLIESQPPGRLAELGLDYHDLEPDNPGLIMVSVTPFGRAGASAGEAATDLTLLAGGGPVWSCGYDDHRLPPVRGGGNQGYHTGCHFAVMTAMAAVLYRSRSGVGQHLDVNMHAASNVTTEEASYRWLVARETVQRQTGRHAAVTPTMQTFVRCADGRDLCGGVPARRPEQFRQLIEWLDELDLLEGFAGAPLLHLGMQGDSVNPWSSEDDETLAKLTAAREAMTLLAQHLPASTLFRRSADLGSTAGVINAPEEALEDEHFQARGFPVEVEHPELGRSVVYPGAPYRFSASPWRIWRRAPLLGEDNAAVYGELGLDASAIAALKADGVI